MENGNVNVNPRCPQKELSRSTCMHTSLFNFFKMRMYLLWESCIKIPKIWSWVCLLVTYAKRIGETMSSMLLWRVLKRLMIGGIWRSSWRLIMCCVLDFEALFSGRYSYSICRHYETFKSAQSGQKFQIKGASLWSWR